MGKIIENIKQNTPEWLEWRKDKIGGSDAPIIMGESKWSTPWQLYMRKLGLIPDQEDNHAMSNGRSKESSCLDYINRSFGTRMVPTVMVSEKYPWMIASLDGWDSEKRVGCEIKCAGKQDHETSSVFGKVPKHYKAQTQHQLDVIGGDVRFFYASFNSLGNAIIEVFRDEDYIKDMLATEVGFIMRLHDLDPPDLCDEDYVENNSREWRLAARAYDIAKQEKEGSEQAYNDARSELIRLSGDRNCKGSGVRITKSVRRGLVEYSRIPELKGVDLEPYRKEKVLSWRVTGE